MNSRNHAVGSQESPSDSQNYEITLPLQAELENEPFDGMVGPEAEDILSLGGSGGSGRKEYSQHISARCCSLAEERVDEGQSTRDEKFMSGHGETRWLDKRLSPTCHSEILQYPDPQGGTCSW